MDQKKQELRERVWGILENEGVALFPGAQGRIPNFKGAERAAQLLSTLPEWKRARSIKANPDSPQRSVRYLALKEGKTIYMAVPRLKERKCFIRVDPEKVPPNRFREASTIKGAFQYGVLIHPREVEPIDLIVAGSVAVNRKGSRVGKGGGFSDLEYALGRTFNFIEEDVVIVTTVHPLQVLEEELPETEHDFRIDFIVTPEELIPTRRQGGRPKGILRDHLSREKISAIPILQEILRWP